MGGAASASSPRLEGTTDRQSGERHAAKWRGRGLKANLAARLAREASSDVPMKLEPFQSVDGTAFSASSADIMRLLGAPQRTGRNEVGLDELDYGGVVYRFQESGRLEEITTQAPVVTFGTVSVPFGTLAAFIRSHDGAAFERAGFLVSPRFGLAFDPADPCWVTAIAEHCVSTWKAL